MAIGAIVVGGALVAAGSAIAAKGMKVRGQTPNKKFYGGSEDMLASYRTRDAYGVTDGAMQAQQGASYLGNAYGQGNKVGAYGDTMFGQGNVTMARAEGMGNLGASQIQQGVQSQNAAMGYLGQAAAGNAPSQAQLMLTQQAGDVARQQQALAATARGGNQAAAMRAAGGEGRAAMDAAAQQAAAMRAGEMATARGQYAQAAQAQLAGGQNIGQYGLAQQSMGLQQQRAGVDAVSFNAQNTAQVGQALGNLGADREGNYLAAENAMNLGQLNADVELEKARAEAKQRKSDRMVNFGGKFVGTGGSIISSAGGGG